MKKLIFIIIIVLLFLMGCTIREKGSFSNPVASIDKQLKDQMMELGEVVSLNRPRVYVSIGDTTQFFLGFKNNQTEPIDFTITSSSCKKVTPTEEHIPCNDHKDDVWIAYETKATEILPGEVKVLPIKVYTNSKATEESTFVFELFVTGGDTITETVELSVELKR